MTAVHTLPSGVHFPSESMHEISLHFTDNIRNLNTNYTSIPLSVYVLPFLVQPVSPFSV